MRALLFVTILAALLPSQVLGKEKQCLQDNASVTLGGFLVEGHFPGPPEYSSVAKGDEDYLASFLYLSEPVCIADGEGALTSLVQLACAGADLPVGEMVSVTGSVFAAHTGYHRSPVLLECK